MLQAGLWALFAALSLVIGAFVGQAFAVPGRIVGAAMGFGAGALLGALAYELIPSANVSDGWIWASFGAGALVFAGADALLERRSADDAGAGLAIALGALLDGVPESTVLGMSVAVGGSVSFGFLVAVFVSNVPESLSATTQMRSSHTSRWIYRLWILIAVVSGLAGAVGYAFAKWLPGADGRYVQAFAGGAVLTMLAGSMMPEAFEEGGRVVPLVTSLGFAVAAVLTLLD
jgi:zinc transporter, ZIP family